MSSKPTPINPHIMTRLLGLFLFVCISAGLSTAQNMPFYLSVYQVPSTPVNYHPVWLKVTPPSGPAFTRSGFTTSGVYFDTVPANSTVTSITYDCNGNSLVSSISVGASGSASDTLFTPCVMGYSQCSPVYAVLPSSGGLNLDLADSSSLVNIAQGKSSYIWQYGDGNADTLNTNAGVSHTYSQPGSYQVCLNGVVEDTVNDIIICSSSYCRDFTVGTPAGACSPPLIQDSLPGSNPFLIEYYVSSTGASLPGSDVYYKYDFGEGSPLYTSSPNAAHTYSAPGNYEVIVTEFRLNSFGDTICSSQDTLNMNLSGAGCVAGFVAFGNNGNISLHDSSAYALPSGAFVRYLIDYGDGSRDTSYNQTQTHYYASPGTYQVCYVLQVIDSSNQAVLCSDSLCQVFTTQYTCGVAVQDTVTPGSLVVSYFIQVNKPANTTSHATIDFGDGHTQSLTGTNVSVNHTYSSAGVYTYSLYLVVTNSLGDTVCSDSHQKSISLTSGGSCYAAFNFSGTAGTQVNFSNFSTTNNFPAGSNVNYLWTFGDGDSSTAINPSHTYAQNGTYTVCLYQNVEDSVQSFPVCISDTCRSIQVTGAAPASCRADFNVNATGLTAFFSNLSTPTFGTAPGNILYKWYFGNGDSSTSYSPTYAYQQGGTYNVCLQQYIVDSLSGQTLCYSDTCMSLQVAAVPPGGCIANLYVFSTGMGSVLITDTSAYSPGTNEAVRFITDFGDGHVDTSYKRTYLHQYQVPGSYTICHRIELVDTLTSTVTCGDTICKTAVAQWSCMVGAYIDSASSTAPIGYFYLTRSWPSGYFPSTRIDFGDGTSMTNPPMVTAITHTYPGPGTYTYTVHLWVKNSFHDTVCTNIFQKSIVIGGVTSSACNANFSYSQFPGSTTLGFTDSSNIPAGTTTSYQWSFGDGQNTSGQNPVHTYGQSGTYQVCLITTARHSNNTVVCADTVCKNITVQPSSPNCVAHIYPLPDGGNKVKFLGTVFGTPANRITRLYEWDFGDGTTSRDKNPTHTYASAGNYQVCLIIYALDSLQDTICGAQVCKTIQAGGVALQNGPGCSAKLSVVLDTINPFGITLIDSSSISFSGNEVIASYLLLGNGRFWYYSGAGTPGNFTTKTIYDSAGTYTACVYHVVTDTVTNQITCVSKDCKTVVIGSNPFCQASYIVDTVNSYQGNVYIWNMSSPADTNSAYNISYQWDFGDGNFSNLPYPVHVYPNSGIYAVCLSMTAKNAAGDTCTSTFCDTLGVDSLGNLIYKGGVGGFTLNVLNPNTISLPEPELMQVEVFPNPAKDRVRVQILGLGDKQVKYKISDMKGRLVLQGEAGADEGRFDIELAHLKTGMYLLSLESEDLPLRHQRLQIRR